MANPTFVDGAIPRRKQPAESLTGFDSVIPVQNIGIYNATPPSLLDGEFMLPQLDDLANLMVTLGDPAIVADLKLVEITNPAAIASVQYDISDVAGATDTGTLALVVRDDTLSTLAVSDGDYTQLRVDSQGSLHVTATTIEQTTGAAHNDENIAVAGKDGSGNVQPVKMDTDGTVAVDIENTPTVNLGTIADIATETTLGILADWDDNDAAKTVAKPQAEQYDDGSPSYHGWANPGVATSAASWRIRRITKTGADISIDWADGDANYDNIWDNRGGLSYS